ncbi:MAG: hypothetical protein J1E02_07335, partial [Coprobacter sp.]|nr:hypothetical protein [Coprobacter sp.]
MKKPKTALSKYAVFVLALSVWAGMLCSCTRREPVTYDKVLVVNELMPSNRTGLLSGKGSPEAWIEIKNITADTVGLKDYAIEVAPTGADTLHALEKEK